jgi:hypothetical protein
VVLLSDALPLPEGATGVQVPPIVTAVPSAYVTFCASANFLPLPE